MLNANNPFIAFVIELFERLGQRSPKFFIVLQWIFGLITAITGLPAVLTALASAVNITLPAVFTSVENKTVALCTMIITIVSALPVQNQPVAKDQNGQTLKQTNEKALPFTAKAERQEAAGINHPIVALKK